ncbi:hypothetical protein AWENTII_011259 [Aspergillus wentii]
MNRNLEVIDGVFKEAPTIADIVRMARMMPRGGFVFLEEDVDEGKGDGWGEDDQREDA